MAAAALTTLSLQGCQSWSGAAGSEVRAPAGGAPATVGRDAPSLREAGHGGGADGCRRSTQDPGTEMAATPRGTMAGNTLRWYIADPGDAQRLEPWCAGVGPAVIVQGLPPAPDPVDSVLVVAWNIHVGGGDLPALAEDLRAGRVTGQPVDHFVLLLQEVYRAGTGATLDPSAIRAPRRIATRPPAGERQDVLNAAGLLGLHAIYVPSMRNGHPRRGAPDEDRGNAILSSLPLTEPAAIVLPFETQRRVAVAAAVSGRTAAGEAWRLRLASVHLDHRSRWTRLLASAGPGRLRQARGLMAMLPPGEALVVGGDFNTWSIPGLEATLPFLRQRLPETPRGDGRPTYPLVAGFGRRLDHIFFRLPPGHQVHTERLDDRYGSDHHPVIGWVHFPTRFPGRP
jgi:endonuclease/exonuclease/phosphatase family metal-dependent hydrolase